MLRNTVGRSSRWIIPLGLAVWASAGCATMPKYLMQHRPEVHIVDVQLQDVTLKSAVLAFALEIENTYTVALPITELDYSLGVSGEPFLSGRNESSATIAPGESLVVWVPTTIKYAELLAAVDTIRPGAVVPYQADLGVSVDAPVLGRLRLPLSKQGQLPIPEVPVMKVRQVRWTNLSLDSAGGRVELEMTNRGQFDLRLSRLDYTLSLGDVVVARSGLAEPVECSADGGAATVEIPLSFSPRQLGLAVFRMLSGGGSGYRLEGTLRVDTPFGPMKLPINVAGETVFRS